MTVNRYGDGRNLVLRWTDPVTGERKAKSAGTTDRRPRLRIFAEAEKGHRDRLLPMKPPLAPRVALVRVAVPAGQQELGRPAVQTAGKPWIVK